MATEELATGERLRLAAPQLDARLRSLLAAVKQRWPAPQRASAPLVRVPERSSAIIGRSPALLQELDRLRRLARGELPILILGESGTGKELAARAVHLGSARSDGPFLPVNSAALSENLLLSELFGHVRGAFTGADRDRAGVFEAARGGTVFLDEIGDLPPVAQGMLLRVLQEHEIRRVGESLPRKVDVRVVAATHRNLVAMVGEGGFRQDLFYRLRVGVISLPPLRDRGEDLIAIAEHVLARCRPGARFSAAAISSLRSHRWPGNIRELANVVETAAAIAESEVIEPDDLQLPQGVSDGSEAPGYHEQVLAYRRKLVQEAFDRSGGRQAEAARSLGLTRQSLSYLVRQLKIG
jgi:DNA-binding NtrC family response regulator